MYVANAGDSRAIMVSARKGSTADEASKTAVSYEQLSTDWTPETDRQRIQLIAYQVSG